MSPIPVLCAALLALQPPVDVSRLDTTLRVDFRADAEAICCGNVPQSLYEMVAPAERIVVGKVLGVVRHEHCPPSSTNADQSTVFAIEVESDVVGSGPRITKVSQMGGPLPWKTEEGGTGVGFRLRENPLLAVGERYLLFLKDFTTQRERHQGFRQVRYGGRVDIITDLDVLGFPFLERGAILLRGGKTASAELARNPKAKPWAFESGVAAFASPPILGIPEEQAIERIRAQERAARELLHPR